MSRVLHALFAALALAAAGTATAGPHFTHVQPLADGGFDVVVVADRPLELFADGRPIDATLEAAGKDRYTGRVTSLPPGTRFLGAGEDAPEVAIQVAMDTPETAPFNDWIVYHVMVAYFNNGARGNDRANMRRWTHKNYAGGDLQGILAKVDYLADLNVNAVWFSPIFQSETSHGYDVQNYYRIGDAVAVPGDPEASLALFRQVRDALRERDIRTILDVPLNHAAGSYDRRAGDPNKLKPRSTKARQAAEKVWEGWGAGFRYWNIGDDRTRQFLRAAAMYWLKDEEVDGLRLDYVRGVAHDFWAELYAEVKAGADPGYLYGEAWQDGQSPAVNAGDIAKYYAPVEGIGPQFDSLIEFPMQMVMTEAIGRGNDAFQMEEWLQKTEALYGGHGRPIYFLDNHDTSRFADWALDAPSERVLSAVTFMSTLSGPIIIYYGTETAMGGSTVERGFTDSNRFPMPWDSLNVALVKSISNVFATRSAHPVLSRGARLPVHQDRDTVVMARVGDGEVALVGVNIAQQPRTVTFHYDYPSADATWSPLIGNSAPTGGDDGLTWTLPPRSTVVVMANPSRTARAE